jgi:hypothetical protein
MHDSHSILALTVEVIGWIGAALILLSFALLTTGRVQARSGLYQGLNIAGSVGFAVNGAWNHAYPSMTMNLIWLVIAIYGLLRADSPRRRQR